MLVLCAVMSLIFDKLLRVFCVGKLSRIPGPSPWICYWLSKFCKFQSRDPGRVGVFRTLPAKSLTDVITDSRVPLCS